MTTITLACAICNYAEEIETAGYQTTPCPDCGTGRVLNGGFMQGSIYWYPYLTACCPACAHVFDPRSRRHVYQPHACPECGLALETQTAPPAG